MADANRMTLGEVVDFCEAYNRRQREAEKAERKAEQKQKKKNTKQSQKRKATAEDYRAWFGG